MWCRSSSLLWALVFHVPSGFFLFCFICFLTNMDPEKWNCSRRTKLFNYSFFFKNQLKLRWVFFHVVEKHSKSSLWGCWTCECCKIFAWNEQKRCRNRSAVFPWLISWWTWWIDADTRSLRHRKHFWSKLWSPCRQKGVSLGAGALSVGKVSLHKCLNGQRDLWICACEEISCCVYCWCEIVGVLVFEKKKICRESVLWQENVLLASLKGKISE